jgi:hypothetical protein
VAVPAALFRSPDLRSVSGPTFEIDRNGVQDFALLFPDHKKPRRGEPGGAKVGSCWRMRCQHELYLYRKDYSFGCENRGNFRTDPESNGAGAGKGSPTMSDVRSAGDRGPCRAGLGIRDQRATTVSPPPTAKRRGEG